MSILERRKALRNLCVKKQTEIQAKEDFARSQGYASYRTYDRILRKKAINRSKTKPQLSWNSERALGHRAHLAYVDGRALHEDLTCRNAYSIRNIAKDRKGENLHELLPRPSIAPCDVARHIHFETSSVQDPIRIKVLSKMDKRIQELESQRNETVLMTTERYREEALNMGDDYEHEDMEQHWQLWEREVGKVERLKNKEIQESKQERDMARKGFEQKFKATVATELRKQNAKHKYTTLCQSENEHQIKSLLDQVGNTTIKLHGYGLTSTHVRILLQCITPKTLKISLEENSIGPSCLQDAFVDFFAEKDCDVRTLNLRDNW